MPEMSKMSLEAMMLFVWLASRMVARACGLALVKAAGRAGAFMKVDSGRFAYHSVIGRASPGLEAQR
jgi:hypothetical protein